jgi:hypothetical protein
LFNLILFGFKLWSELKVSEFFRIKKVNLSFSMEISFLRIWVLILEFIIEGIIIYYIPKAFLKLHTKMIKGIMGASFYEILAEKMIGE